MSLMKMEIFKDDQTSASQVLDLLFKMASPALTTCPSAQRQPSGFRIDALEALIAAG